MNISYLHPAPPLQTATNTDLIHLLESYTFCARAEGKSPKTIDIRITAVLSLVQFLRASNLSTAAADVGPGELRRFILHLQKVPAYLNHPFSRPRRHGLSGHTINGYLRSIRDFWSWLVAEEIIDSSPFARVHIPRAPRKVIPTFTEAQLQTLLGAMPHTTGTGFRDWTMAVTMIDTGIRASELVGLTLDAVNFEDNVLRVSGKGGKERMVPIGATVQRAIWRYIRQYRPQPRRPACTTVFLNRDGEPMTVNCLENRIRDYGSKACIEGVRCSPHTFRHTFAINYLRNGGDVFSLQPGGQHGPHPPRVDESSGAQRQQFTPGSDTHRCRNGPFWQPASH